MRRFPTAYFAIVVAVAVSRGLSGYPSPHDWGMTSDELGAGKVWLLATSGLIVDGSAVPQLVALALTLALVLRQIGARFATVVMIVAHVGATLLAYAILLAATGEADGLHSHSNDYGTSAVWLGLFGALAVGSLRTAVHGDRRAGVLIASALVTLVAAITFFPLMTATEHALAFALGAGLAALREARRLAGRSARSAASTGSARAEAA